MPELPELEVVAEVLRRRVIGQSITALEVSKADGPLVVRDLTHGDFVQSLIGQTFVSVARRGKFLILPLSPAALVPPAGTSHEASAAVTPVPNSAPASPASVGRKSHRGVAPSAAVGASLVPAKSRSTAPSTSGRNSDVVTAPPPAGSAPAALASSSAPAISRDSSGAAEPPPGAAPLYLVINPKLTGRLQLAAPDDKRMAHTVLICSLSGGGQLRYVDQKRMGQVYLTRDPAAVQDFAGMGPEPLDVSFDDFRARMKPFRGEIKGVLTRGQFVAGIGNAYADEILWAAGLYPYRKRTALKPDEVRRLYDAMQLILREATAKVRAEMGEQIHLKPREFLAVHMKGGQPCPRCGTAISLIGANQRITNFCRTCQPGSLFRGG